MLRPLGTAALIIALATGCGAGTAPGPIRPDPRSTATGHDGHSHGEDAQDQTPPPPEKEAAPVAAGFAAAWAQHQASPQQWWDAVSRWCAEDLAGALHTTQPANVPAQQVTGPAVQIGGSTTEGLIFQIPTNAGILTVTVAALGGEWKVTTIDFARGTP